MSLSSVANPAWESIRGVRFAMQFGPTLVPVLVTPSALESLELPTAGIGGHLACFNKHRDMFEQVASAKHQRGHFDEMRGNGGSCRSQDDLKLLASAGASLDWPTRRETCSHYERHAGLSICPDAA